MLEEHIRALLACPTCKGEIQEIHQGKERALHCSLCNVFYPIYKGIPILLKKDALTQEEWQKHSETE